MEWLHEEINTHKHQECQQQIQVKKYIIYLQQDSIKNHLHNKNYRKIYKSRLKHINKKLSESKIYNCRVRLSTMEAIAFQICLNRICNHK